MLRADGLSAEAFMRLWHAAMWDAPDLGERARLVLELGRLEVLEGGQAAPLLITFAPEADDPVLVLPLPEAPSARAPELRARVREGLTELGASEVFVVMSLAAGERHGVPHFVLTAWGESRDGEEACWVLPFRRTLKGLQEAEALRAPDPGTTVLSQELRGLLRSVH